MQPRQMRQKLGFMNKSITDAIDCGVTNQSAAFFLIQRALPKATEWKAKHRDIKEWIRIDVIQAVCLQAIFIGTLFRCN